VGVSWVLGSIAFYRLPWRISLKFNRSPFAVYRHYRPQAKRSDGKSDGKTLLGALLSIFAVRRTSGLRETLQIVKFSPARITGLGTRLIPILAYLRTERRTTRQSYGG
jgi:hypothetical protein